MLRWNKDSHHAGCLTNFSGPKKLQYSNFGSMECKKDTGTQTEWNRFDEDKKASNPHSVRDTF